MCDEYMIEIYGPRTVISAITMNHPPTTFTLGSLPMVLWKSKLPPLLARGGHLNFTP
jgi:hypothetical protein